MWCGFFLTCYLKSPIGSSNEFIYKTLLNSGNCSKFHLFEPFQTCRCIFNHLQHIIFSKIVLQNRIALKGQYLLFAYMLSKSLAADLMNVAKVKVRLFPFCTTGTDFWSLCHQIRARPCSWHFNDIWPGSILLATQLISHESYIDIPRLFSSF